MKEHRNCKVITNQKDKYDLEVVECNACGFHLGIDVSYLEQVDGVSLACPGCTLTLTIPGEGDADGETTPFDQAARTPMPTPAPQQDPVVPALLTSDDSRVKVTVDAEKWLTQLSDDVLLSLCQDSGPGALTDDLYWYLDSDLDHDTENKAAANELFVYLDACNKAGRVSDPVGFSVHINPGKLHSWVQEHRPAVWARFFPE